MDAGIAMKLGTAPAEREEDLVRGARESRERVLSAVAIAMVAAIWFVVPIAGVCGIYYMSGSPAAPIVLAAVLGFIMLANYKLFRWMLIASEELELERPLPVVTKPAEPVMGPATGEDQRKAAGEVHRTAA